MASSKLPKELRNDLAEMFDRGIRRAAGEAPVQGEDCLRLLELLPSNYGRWRAGQARHVQTCRRCQRMIALAWRNECPHISQIIRNAGPKPAAALTGAFQIHLREDRCPRCAAVESWARGLGLAAGHGSSNLRKLRPVVAKCAESESGKPALAQSTSADGG